MVRAFQIGFFGWLVFCLAGCGPAEPEPIWERVKIGDLAPSKAGQGPSKTRLRTINFDVHIFEIPAENISALDELWPMVYRQPLQLYNMAAFEANSFSAGLGQLPMWNRIAEVLRGAGGKRAGMISLFLADGNPQDVFVAGLPREQTVFYVSNEGLTEGASVGPGRLALRIKADKILGARGVCKVTVIPAFSRLVGSSIPLLRRRDKSAEFLFGSAGFSLKMSPGDFVLLGPDEYLSQQITLGSLMFCKPEGSLFFNGAEQRPPELKPAIRIFLLFCTRISF